VSFREQAHDGERHLIRFADDDALDIRDNPPGKLGQLRCLISFLRWRRDGQLDFFIGFPRPARHEDILTADGAGGMLADERVRDEKSMGAMWANAFGHGCVGSIQRHGWRWVEPQFLTGGGLCPA
jgi:hypothetical protein